jgi:integrase
LTDAFLRDASPGTYFDTHPGAPGGFLARKSKNGVIAFDLDYRTPDRQQRRQKIGRMPQWTVAAARAAAREYRKEIDRGRDPRGELVAAREAPDFDTLNEDYQAERLPRKAEKTQREELSIIKQHLIPRFAGKKLAEITRGDVERMRNEITEKAPVRANRTLACLSAMLTFAISQGKLEVNVCRGVERNKEHPRETYLNEEQLVQLISTLDALRVEHPDLADAVEWALLTGCRRGEMLAARWCDVDLIRGVWTKPAPTVKSRREHRVPLSGPALDLLRNRQARQTVALHPKALLFPLGHGDKRSREGNFDRGWHRVREMAGIDAGVRGHDLRHSYASTLVAQGHDLLLVMKMLGHRRIATTQRYSHLQDEALRLAAESVGRTLRGAGC